jgi:hypothetical protein
MLTDAVVYDLELTAAQRTGMRYLEQEGLVEYDAGTFARSAHWHFHCSRATLYEWSASEARRLRYDIEMYAVDEVDELRLGKQRSRWLRAA